MNEEVYIKLIEELHLEKNKRMAVFYFNSIGDVYSLCCSMRYAEKQLGKEYIILYYSDNQEEIISWFHENGSSLKSHRISRIQMNALYDLELRKKYCDYIIFWNLGDNEFREMTLNINSKFAANSEMPIFPPVDIMEKYGEYIIPQKTVLIVPEANALSSMPDYFWNFAAEMFRYMGYKVIFNASSDKEKIYNGKCMLIPLSDAVAFANECGVVFAIRTGLLDVLSTSTAKMIIFSTKAYEPLDVVFNIPNEDKRINTIYFEDNDPYFDKFLSNFGIIDYFKKFYHGLYTLSILPENSSPTIHQASSIDCYRIMTNHNKFVKSLKCDIFLNLKYSLCLENDRLCFSVYDLDVNNYRFDYEIYCNGRMITRINDFRLSCFSYGLELSGEYSVRVFITDTDLCKQEYFNTITLQYNARVPARRDELPDCRDLYSYILALKTFETDLLILIVSRDAHTFSKINKDTRVLRMMKLLGLQLDFENTYRSSYIGIINGGTVVKEMYSPDRTIKYECEIDSKKIYLESTGFNAVNHDRTSVKIDINGTQYAVDKRGLNFVVWDKRSGKLLDSVAFDSFRGNGAHRKNDIDF